MPNVQSIRSPQMPDSEKLRGERALAFCKEFHKVRPTMPLQYVTAFLLVAMNEGMSVQEYAELADVSQSVMTRCLLDMGERNRYKEPGFGLIMQRMDPMDMRRHQTFLTPQGRALWRRVLQTFE